MKLSKIQSLCKAEKKIILYNTPKNKQWIGNGFAIYPLDELPLLDARKAIRIDSEDVHIL